MKFEELTARDLMSTKIETCDSESSVMEALKHMNASRIHCLLIDAPESGRSPGVISIKDIVQLLGDAGPDLLDELVVSEVMTSPVVSLPDYLLIPDCVNLMRMTGVRSAPVMKDREMVGVLSYSDVVSWIARNA
ncbi:MAG: CBS domain-containing protein [Myxococcota bacterium]|jgi:CBS domain-containing protein|nr:CBS domain-containing protein [Myxococcota bacterium]